MSVHSSWFQAGAVRPVLFDQVPGHVYMGHYKNISLVVWAGAADGATVMRARGISQHLVSSYPDGHSNVSFVLNGVAPPTEEARLAFNHIFDGRVSDLRSMAVVLEGEGFWASTLRSTVTWLRQAATTQFAVRLFNNIDEVAEWLPPEHEARTGVAVTSADLRAAMNIMRYELAK
jgi:hypothetical protein